MRIRQEVVLRIVDVPIYEDDIYDADGIDEQFDSDSITAAEQGFMRGYIES